MRSMESSPASYTNFEAITLQNPSIYSIFSLIRDWYGNKGARAKLLILWIILASSYVVAFSMLLSAMTGESLN